MNKNKLIADIYWVMYELVREYWKENLEKEFEKLKSEAIVWLADDERGAMESDLFDN
jgi:hypothetical protein